LSDLTTHTIDPIPRKLLKEELNRKRFVRNTNKLDNEIYIVDAHNSPNTMQEIGRLREVSFAEAGGGTGNSVDIDEYDTQERCYQQLIVWSPEDEEIVGGYRFMDCADIWNLDPIPLSTTHYFNFSERFIKTFMPYTIELGRSWVQPKYQPQVNARKGVFALDNLWDGLGAVVANSPHAKYFFGKVTMYTHFNQEARDAVLSFMHHYFPDADKLVWPIAPLPMYNDMTSFLASLQGLDFKEGLRVLSAYVRERDELIPPLINNYMQLSATMKMFGTAMNNDFGAVEESAILVTIKDIYPEKHERYVTPYLKERK
jgi:hypothetical protein